MKITAISAQQKLPNRVNIFIDGTYRFSLDVFQVSDLGLRIEKEYSEEELRALEEESEFGKLYARALEYTLMRPHSIKELRDYVWKKTRDTQVQSRKTGELKLRKGVSQQIADRVLERLIDKGYLDDEKFARWWVENRNLRKGTSQRRLALELRTKGVSPDVIQDILQNSTRDEKSELQKIMIKKASKYADERKLIAYLVSQGFSYSDVREAVDSLES